MAVPLIERCKGHAAHIAVVDSAGEHTYGNLAARASAVAAALLGARTSLDGARVAFMTAPGHQYVAALLGVWMAGGMAVPLCRGLPVPEIRHVLQDSGARFVVADAEHLPHMHAATSRASSLEKMVTAAPWVLPEVAAAHRALILYTSGTTSRPKGVVTTHANIQAMITPLVTAWEWRRQDRILHVLPLHHAHGLVNALLCCLWAGATCEMLQGFNARAVWERFGYVTLFMAVPTMYHKLLREWRTSPPAVRKAWAQAAAGPRLMVSGSAALPESLLDAWERVTGQRLLERYGMTEIGMALSNPLAGERRRGAVGQPLPGIDVRLVDEEGETVVAEGASGVLHVRGPGVFREYWGQPGTTREAFHDGWFRTGDVAVVQDGYYRILGREADIIKTGGEKVSAPEVEAVLHQHPAIDHCAVVGIQDAEWGQRVCAAAVVHPGCSIDPEALRRWAKARLAGCKVPSRVVFLDALPQGTTGKVFRPALRRLFQED